MWKERLKKGIAVLVLITLVPYIITIFIQGVGKRKEREDIREEGICRLAQELSEEYEDEMLYVQAILVRTSILREKKEGTYTATDYRGRISGAFRRRLGNAWDNTAGMVLTYNGEPILAPFHQLSNGRTRNGKDVLGNPEFSYLHSVNCPKDVASNEQIGTLLLDVEDVKIVSKDKKGYVTEVMIGEETCSGEKFRDVYHVQSADFELYEAGEQTRVVTHGIGHGLGLSQHTANEMAKEGKTKEEILLYFFKDVKIEKKE